MVRLLPNLKVLKPKLPKKAKQVRSFSTTHTIQFPIPKCSKTEPLNLTQTNNISYDSYPVSSLHQSSYKQPLNHSTTHSSLHTPLHPSKLVPFRIRTNATHFSPSPPITSPSKESNLIAPVKSISRVLEPPSTPPAHLLLLHQLLMNPTRSCTSRLTANLVLPHCQISRHN